MLLRIYTFYDNPNIKIKRLQRTYVNIKKYRNILFSSFSVICKVQ